MISTLHTARARSSGVCTLQHLVFVASSDERMDVLSMFYLAQHVESKRHTYMHSSCEAVQHIYMTNHLR